MALRKPMKLLVVTMLYDPDCVGIAAIASDMCAALAERGHDVTVYTSYPYYPEWKLKTDVNPWRIQQEWKADVCVKRYGLFIPSNPSRTFPRLLHELSFPVSLMRSLWDRPRFDAVMVYCPLLGSVVYAAIRKLLCREPLWVNIQDIPTDAAMATGINRSNVLHRLASGVQKYLFNRGEAWSSISPHMVQRLETLKSPKTTIHLCPNWLTSSLAEQTRQVPSKVGRPAAEPPRLLYCGTIGKKQGLLEFCQRLQTVDLKFHFQIRGEGGEARGVKQWVEASGDSRFEFAGLLPEAEFVQALHAADWFVVPEKPGAGFSFFPSKLIPCISVGTPVLAICDRSGPLGSEVHENEVGIVVEWSELDRLSSRLAEFQQDHARFETLQKNCLRRAAVYSREHAIDRLEDLLQAFSAGDRRTVDQDTPDANGDDGPGRRSRLWKHEEVKR